MTRLATRLQTPDAPGRRRARPQSGAGDRVLFGGWGRTHTRWAGRPSSPVRRPRSLSRPWAHERRYLHAPPPSSACRTGSPPAWRAACPVTGSRFELDARLQPGGLPALRFVSGGLRSLALPAPQPRSSRGREPALGPRLNKVGSRALRRPAGAGAPSCQAPRLRGLPVVRWRRLPTPARAGVSATPALHPDEAFELS